jgi:hypothetical protein
VWGAAFEFEKLCDEVDFKSMPQSKRHFLVPLSMTTSSYSCIFEHAEKAKDVENDI